MVTTTGLFRPRAFIYSVIASLVVKGATDIEYKLLELSPMNWSNLRH